MARSRFLFALLVLAGFLIGVPPAPLAARQGGPPASPLSKRARLSAAFSGPLTVDTKGDTLEVFRRVAGAAGIQVVFHSGFQPATLPKEFVLKDVDIFSSLDALATKTRAVWEAYDSRIVVVAPENERDSVEMQAIESVDLNAMTGSLKLSEIAGVARSRVPSLKMTPGLPENALTFRDSIENVALVEKTIFAMADTVSPGAPAVAGAYATDFAGNAYAIEGGQMRKTIAEAHASLRPKAQGSMPLRIQGTAAEVFKTIAERFGFQVQFHRQFASKPVMSLDLSDVDGLAALDLAAFQSSSFWQTVDSHTIAVAADNPTVRREVEEMAIQVISVKARGHEALATIRSGLTALVDNVKPQAEPAPVDSATVARLNEGAAQLTELQNAARAKNGQPPLPPPAAVSAEDLAARTRPTAAPSQRGDARTVFVESAPLNALLIRDTADRIARDEAVIALLDRQAGALPARNPSFALGGGVLANPVDGAAVRNERARLKLRSNEPISLEIKGQSRQWFEILAERAGLQVVFHRQFANTVAIPFSIEETDILTALDRLAWQTGNSWRAFGPHTIVIFTDNPTVHREVDPMVVKVIYLNNARTVEEANEIVDGIRRLIGASIQLNATTSTLVVRNIPERVPLVEQLVAILDSGTMPAGTAPSGPVSATAGFEAGTFGNPANPQARRARLRAQPELDAETPGAIEFTETTGKSFQLLAGMAGVNVVFPSQPRLFTDSTGRTRFRFEGGDFIEALDLLAFQTGTFWELIDDKVIQVATDNPTVRRDLYPNVTETLVFQNIRTLEGVKEAVATIRAASGVSGIEEDFSNLSSPYRIRVTAARDERAVVRYIVGALDVPGRMPLIVTTPPGEIAPPPQR